MNKNFNLFDYVEKSEESKQKKINILTILLNIKENMDLK